MQEIRPKNCLRSADLDLSAYSGDVISTFRRDVNSHWTKPLRGIPARASRVVPKHT